MNISTGLRPVVGRSIISMAADSERYVFTIDNARFPSPLLPLNRTVEAWPVSFCEEDGTVVRGMLTPVKPKIVKRETVFTIPDGMPQKYADERELHMRRDAEVPDDVLIHDERLWSTQTTKRTYTWWTVTL